DVVESRWVLRAGQLPLVLLLVKLLDAAVDAEVDRLGKAFQVSRAVRTCMLLDPQPAGVDDAHASSPQTPNDSLGHCSRSSFAVKQARTLVAPRRNSVWGNGATPGAGSQRRRPAGCGTAFCPACRFWRAWPAAWGAASPPTV